MSQFRPLGSATAGICVLAVAVIQAADTPKTEKDPHLVTVRGCLHGLVLTTTDEIGTKIMPSPTRFDLTGNRTTLEQLKKYSGRFLEVTGVLKRGTGTGGTRVTEKPIPKGRIYLGVGSTPVTAPGTPPEDPAAASTLDVHRFTDIDRCP
jgi:hypothetical protein